MLQQTNMPHYYKKAPSKSKQALCIAALLTNILENYINDNMCPYFVKDDEKDHVIICQFGSTWIKKKLIKTVQLKKMTTIPILDKDLRNIIIKATSTLLWYWNVVGSCVVFILISKIVVANFDNVTCLDPAFPFSPGGIHKLHRNTLLISS